jgi:hypothetical protein
MLQIIDKKNKGGGIFYFLESVKSGAILLRKIAPTKSPHLSPFFPPFFSLP